MTTEDISRIKELLSSPKKIIITTHRSPDADAIGSSLGLYHFLLKKKHDVIVITPNSYPEFLHWLPGNKDVINYEGKKNRAKKLVMDAELIFCLDYNALKRMEEFGEVVGESKAIKILIDHHQQPDKFPDYILSDVTASSTAQLIYRFIEMLGEEKMVNSEIAECLYAGIMTDTGSFRFSSTSSETHRIVAKLIDAGVKPDKIYNLIFDDNSVDRMNLLGYTLLHKLKYFPEYRTAMISLTRVELKQFKYKQGDTEGFVNYPLSIKGVRLSALMIEKKGLIKLSFRSKGSFSVNKFSREHFSGGGHNNAAGGESRVSMDETVNKFLSLLPLYKDELINE